MIAQTSRISRWGRRIAAALFACALVACSSAGPKASPALWAVRDGDTTIYLLGTMHALPANTDWDDGAVGKAIAASAELVMELSPNQLTLAAAEFAKLAPRAAPLPMEQRLSGAALANYRDLAEEDALNGAVMDDWAVTIALGSIATRKADLSVDDGVEAGLTAQFRRAKKRIGGLETARAQMRFFEHLDPQVQRAMLTQAAAQADDAAAQIRALTAAWSRGDVAALERLIDEDIDTMPAVRQTILTDRNRRWAAWIAQRMAKPGAVLVAVGAGHMVGDDGLPALLAAEGLKVERLQ